MNQNHIYEFCQTIYNCTYLPLNYYRNNTLELSLPFVDADFNLAGSYLSQLIKKEFPVSYLITNEFHYYGLVRDETSYDCILIGPVMTSKPTEKSIRNIMRELGIPSVYKEKVTELYQFIPLFSFYQFYHFLSLFYREIYQTSIDIETYLGLRNMQEIKSIAVSHSVQTCETKETEQFHNTYYYEQQYLEYVRKGNVSGLKKFFSQEYSLLEGQIAGTPLRQAKNILIVAVTLATRQAIVGGLDIESAYQLSDIYIQEGEKLQTPDALYQLQDTMLMDFTNRVAQAQLPVGTTSDINKCIQFIQQHTNQAITVSDVADYVGKSRSHISRTFKKELGFQMNEFIMRCKLEEAKMLLTYTDKSISEISSYLCFSSQGHFQNSFKKKYGITPNEFRKRPQENSLSRPVPYLKS